MEQIIKLENMEKKEALSRVKAWNLDAGDMEVLSVLIPELKENEDERIRKALIWCVETIEGELGCSDAEGISVAELKSWLEKLGKKEYALKSFKDVDVHKFVQYIERQAKAYELNLPNRSYDIYGFAKDILSWLEKQGEQKSVPFKAEHGKYYYCIKNYFSGGKKQASKGDVVQALRGLPIMGLDDASEFFLPVNDIIQLNNNINHNDRPKFKVGDCITNGIDVDKIIGIDIKENYLFENGKKSDISLIESISHIWTIQDAKDGDVLVASDGSIFLFKCDVNGGCKYYIALTTDNTIVFNVGLEHLWETSKAVHPATKEQCDLLFQKMKEAGYEWDAEKKELKKIEQTLANKVKPKFKVGDTIHEIGERRIFPMVIEEIKNGDYVCDNESSFINIVFQDKYELVEPKFKVGDWIIRNSEYTDVPVQVIEFKGYYRCELNGKIVTFTLNDVHNNFRLWTIEDARAGDMLHTTSTASNETFIFKGLTTEGNIVCYCSYDSEDKYCEGTHHFIGKPTSMTHPATKEQRDKLENAITKAGYKWDAEKMELKKIEQDPDDKVEKNAFEWSEQDENNKDLLIEIIRRDLKLSADEFTRLAGWLTNLKDRLNSRPKSLIHDGTKQMFNSIANYLHYKGYDDESDSMRAFINKDVIGITEFINEISEYLKTNMNGSDPEFIEKFKTFVKILFYEKESKS